ncbi:MAG: FMN-binding protein [Phycisphaerae bacterium]|nr:FMN-binding protein [Phycisphaerae bacterium]
MHRQARYFLEESWLLLIATILFGVLLASLDAAWRPRIIHNEIAKFNRLAGAMLSEAAEFRTQVEALPVESGKGKTIATEIKKGVDANGRTVGWAFIAEGPGFADKIRLVVAVDAAFEELRGFGVLFSNETPGFGDKMKTDDFRNQFVGAPASDLELGKTGDRSVIDDHIVAITGATVTSEAVVDVLNRFVGQVRAGMKEKGLI